MNKYGQYDVLIIGGSYAGLSAGMALGRALRTVLIVDSGSPCNERTPFSHNFLTNDGKAPKDIVRIAKEQVSKYGSVSFVQGTVTTVAKAGQQFEVSVQSGEVFSSKKLILATGIKDIMPSIKGFDACWGISVLHCPYCHGYEVRNQKTGILANGDVAFELSALISNWTDDLTLFTNGKSTLTNAQTGSLTKHNIVIVETEVHEIEHDNGYAKNIVLKNETKVAIQALYVRIPFIQHSSVPEQLACEITSDGYIKVDAAQRTSIDGVYACGDNVTRMRTIANAVAMGTTTGIMLNKELIDERF